MTKRLSVVVLVAATFATAPVMAQEPAAKPASNGQPADLCQELLAFVKPPATANPPAATPTDPKQQTAVSAPTGKAEEKPGAAAGVVQQKSGLSGPVSNDSTASGVGGGGDAAKSGGDAAKSAADARRAANSAAKAPTPAPTTPPPPTKPSPEAVAQAEAAAAANDAAGCRASVQSMRRAGVTVPSPLLALGALDPKFFAAR